MTDGRKNNSGTLGNKGGRPPKADEIALIERLSPMDDVALDALKKGVSSGEFNFVKLFMEYRYGKPKQDISLSGEMNITNEPIVFE